MLNFTLGPMSDLNSYKVVMEDIEHLLPKTPNIYVQILSGIILCLILICNGTLFYYIFKKESKLTDLDKMMFLDSMLCIFYLYNFSIISNTKFALYWKLEYGVRPSLSESFKPHHISNLV